jgi:hypothetical protein
MESVAQGQHRAAALAQSHRPDMLGDRPPAHIAADRIAAPDRLAEAVDPIEPLLGDVPEGTFAKLVPHRNEDLDRDHARLPILSLGAELREKVFLFLASDSTSGTGRGGTLRRFFDRLSLPSRQKLGQDGIRLALLLPNPAPNPRLPVRYGIATPLKMLAIVYLTRRDARGNRSDGRAAQGSPVAIAS